ncbi:MAG: S-layer homology domain-containing protein [Clostridiales bacterium]|nr:S-layer homology domain-containing protein [Clostridiales bacterium]
MKRIVSLILTSAIAVSQGSFAFANEQLENFEADIIKQDIVSCDLAQDSDTAGADNVEEDISFDIQEQSAEVIEISTAEELKAAAAAVNSDANGCEGVYYKLVNDIDLNNELWSSYIGSHRELAGVEYKPFKGIFDGNGHVIRNYKISCDHKIAGGIFGALGGNAVVKNLGIENVTISIDKEWVWTTGGGIVGFLGDNATVSNCYAKSVHFTTGIPFDINKMEFSYAGGIVGKAVGGNIENSYALNITIDDRPTGQDDIAAMFGAVAGYIQEGTVIRNCYTNVFVAPSTKVGTTVVNSYYTITPGWPWNTGADENSIYLGTQITDNALRNIASTLGDSFADDTQGLINNGYPILTWEQDSRFLPGEARIVSSIPQDNADNVSAYRCSVSILFDKFIDYSTLDEDSIIIEPNAKLTLDKKEGTGSDKVEFILDKLERSTTYTVTFKDSVKTIAGDNIAEDSKLSFTTISTDPAAGLTNLVQNGDMEDINNLNVFKNSNPAASGHISFMNETDLKGTKNSVLRLNPGWEDEPVVARDSITKPGKYYMSAWVKSDNKQNIVMAVQSSDKSTGEAIWASEKIEVQAGEWTFIACEFDIDSNLVPEEISIRAGGGKPMSVDEWSIYDISEAPNDEVFIVDCNIENDAKDISPISPIFEVQFNVPVRQGTLMTGISLVDSMGAKKAVDADFAYNDLLNCKINCGDILPGERYTLDLSGVKSVANKTIGNDAVVFNTIAGNGKNANVISTYPVSGAKEIKKDDLPIIIEFDGPINSKTIGNITISPDLGAVPEMNFLDSKRCIINIDKSKFKNGTEYTVTVPASVETVDKFNTNEYSFTFTTISDEGLIDNLNNALGNFDAVKTFFENDYNEMGLKCEIYDYLAENRKEILNDVFELISNEKKFDSVKDVCKRINACALKVIACNISDIEEIKSVVEIKNGVLGDKVLNIYTTILDEKNRNAVANDMINNKSSEPIELVSKLTEDVICRALKLADGANAIRSILADTKEYFAGEDDISDLIKTAESNAFPTMIYGNMKASLANAASYAQIKSALQRAIQEAQSAANKPSNSSGSSGSGGGGSVVYNSAKTPDKPIEIKPEENVIFKDLDEVSWAKDSILGLYNRGIINGRAEKIFAPNEKLTRFEFTKMVILAMDATNESAAANFKDIHEDHWAYKYIASAYQSGIIQGISDDMFGGEMSITRQDIAVILERILKQQKIEIDSISLGFSDYKEISDYAQEAVGHLAYIGVINGRDDSSFAPNDTATRAEVAVMLDRFLGFLKSGEGK